MKNFTIGKKINESAAILIDAILYWKEFDPEELETQNVIPVIVIKKKRTLDNTYMMGKELLFLFKRMFIDWYVKTRFTYQEIKDIGAEQFNTLCNNWWNELSKVLTINNDNIEINKY